jgi:methylglutaconyl-CoA hydratase
MSSVTSTLDARGVATVTLNRAAKHNALDGETIGELHAALRSIAGNGSARVVVLTGAGASFCAGADIAHMKGMLGASGQTNYEDALKLASCLQALDELPVPTIAKVNGNTFGGGIGLIACCDIAIGVDGAKLALKEVKLGIVPATISPYVVAAIGERQSRRLFLTSAMFDAAEAKSMGLLHATGSAEDLDALVEAQIQLLLQAGPKAAAAAKGLIRMVRGSADRGALNDQTARLLASLRISAEGQEGLSAFLERRKPEWTS